MLGIYGLWFSRERVIRTAVMVEGNTSKPLERDDLPC